MVVNGVWFGVVEIAIGVIGLVLGAVQRSARSTTVIALGLVVMGVSHFIRGHIDTYLADVGALILLFGLGMMVSHLRHRKPKNKRGSR